MSKLIKVNGVYKLYGYREVTSDIADKVQDVLKKGIMTTSSSGTFEKCIKEFGIINGDIRTVHFFVRKTVLTILTKLNYI